jgi:hypothetical protein
MLKFFLFLFLVKRLIINNLPLLKDKTTSQKRCKITAFLLNMQIFDNKNC